jgi:hypothetical protein
MPKKSGENTDAITPFMSASARKETLERGGQIDHWSITSPRAIRQPFMWTKQSKAKLSAHVISFAKEIDPRRERKLMKDRSREMLDAPWLTFAMESTAQLSRKVTYDHMTNSYLAYQVM